MNLKSQKKKGPPSTTDTFLPTEDTSGCVCITFRKVVDRKESWESREQPY
jgi:hypothetical protein